MRFFIACMAFALPSYAASPPAEVRRGFEAKLMGSADIAFKHPRFALITDVYCGSSAKKAGLQKGDVLWKIDGRVVENMSGAEFLVAIARLERVPWIILAVRRGTATGPIEKIIHYPPRTGGRTCPPDQDI